MPWKFDTLHPLFVHFPIALLSTGWLFDLLGTSLRRESLRQAGWWCQVFGVISVGFAVTTGFLADTVIGHMDDPFPIFQTHGMVQIIASLLFIGTFSWRALRRSKLPEKPMLYLYFLVGGIAVALLFYGAHLGAQLAGRI